MPYVKNELSDSVNCEAPLRTVQDYMDSPPQITFSMDELVSNIGEVEDAIRRIFSAGNMTHLKGIFLRASTSSPALSPHGISYVV